MFFFGNIRAGKVKVVTVVTGSLPKGFALSFSRIFQNPIFSNSRVDFCFLPQVAPDESFEVETNHWASGHPRSAVSLVLAKTWSHIYI